MEFAHWLDEVDAICTRFLGVNHRDVETNEDTEVFDLFKEGIQPIDYVRDHIFEQVVYMWDMQELEEIVAENVMWGKRRI